MTTKSQAALRLVSNELRAQRGILTQVLDTSLANNQSLIELTTLLTDIRAGYREIRNKNERLEKRTHELERENRALTFRLQQLEKVR